MTVNIKVPYFKIESFGAVDGPGVRLVVFLQGCPYRCKYCHNPESWKILKTEKQIAPQEIIDLFLKNKSFYKNNGGITLSGGEPLIHLDFCIEICKLASQYNINVALDTSGANFTKENLFKYQQIIKYKPLWLIDIKHINSKKHFEICDVEHQFELDLISFLEKNKQQYWIRQVLLPGYTDDENDLKNLGKYLKNLKYMSKFELLPYHILGIQKYESLKISYPLIGIKAPTPEQINNAMKIIKKNMSK